ncbi:MAG TPA: hypothetical protein K8V88_03510, partial [Companilactobacillus farciminis]|nr:hypothetical protein [Companilactobacillus farciminis]
GSSLEHKFCDGSAAKFFVSALALTKRPSFEILRLWGHAKAQNSVDILQPITGLVWKTAFYINQIFLRTHLE